MNDFTEEDLNNYLQSQIDLRHRQVSKTVEEVQQIIQQLTAEVSAKDGRFQSISHSGFYNDNIKVLTPSLFLISVPIRGLSGYREKKARQWRYYTLSGSKLNSPVREPEKLLRWLELENFSNSAQEWHDTSVAIEGDVVPAKVLSLFKDLVENAIKVCNLTGKVSVLESVGSVVRVAVETSELQVEVELIPTVELLNCWPKRARWPRFFKRWPSKEKARCIKSFGYNLMAASNYHWLLSFSRAEQVLMSSIDDDGGCRRKCYRITRQLKENVWCPGGKPVINAYHLQTLLLWSCEKYPRTKDWRNFKKSFLRLVKKLLKCVSQRYLRHYFVRGYNLLKYTNTSELDIMAKKITDFLENPQLYIH
ncbi:protein mab-21-like 3 [Polypterus senegalus]|uniref:protein mab-21-like 3 n=1 Tax=Polypterus senegalus TaxID=55291 RepID=UPI001962E6C9|nr:protein mab-21-like 3 [Polypterus senegalus]